MAKITVRRKGYTRKAYTRKDGTRVKATRVKGSTFQIEDRGKPGRGPKTIQIKHKGALGGSGYAHKSATTRHRLLAASVRRDGYAETARRLNALRVFGSRTMSAETRRNLAADMKWLKAHKK